MLNIPNFLRSEVLKHQDRIPGDSVHTPGIRLIEYGENVSLVLRNTLVFYICFFQDFYRQDTIDYQYYLYVNDLRVHQHVTAINSVLQRVSRPAVSL